jgi:dihydropyrimidinase
VLWDTDVHWTITLDELHHDSDYSIWEGWPCVGRPVTTIVRGVPVVEDGRLVGSPAHGQWLARAIVPEVLAGPAA